MKTLSALILFTLTLSSAWSSTLEYPIATNVNGTLKQGKIYFQNFEEFKDKGKDGDRYFIRHDVPQLRVNNHDYPLVFNVSDYSQEWLALSVCNTLGLDASGGGFMGNGSIKNPNQMVAFITLNQKSKRLYTAKIMKLADTKFINGTGSIDVLWCGNNHYRSSFLEGHPDYKGTF